MLRVEREEEREELERYVCWAEANTRAGRAEPIDDVVLETAADEGCAMTLESIEAFSHIWGWQSRESIDEEDLHG